jgi:FeS assembly protein IscX
MSVRFVALREMVRALEGFAEEPGHPVNERILEEIQRHWVEERAESVEEEE